MKPHPTSFSITSGRIDSTVVCATREAIRMQLPSESQCNRKPDGTFFDEREKVIEQDLVALIEELWHGIRIIAEETRSAFGASGYSDPNGTAFNDPRDGTALAKKGVNLCGTSVAIFDPDARPVLAVFCQPALSTYVARMENGRLTAWKDGQEIVRQTPNVAIRDSYVCCGSDAHHRLKLEEIPCKIRAFGATAAHLCLLAEDQTGDPIAVALTRYKRYDAAAGLIIAQAAGKDIYDLTTGLETSFEEVFRNGTDNQPLLVTSKPFGRLLALRLKLRQPHQNT